MIKFEYYWKYKVQSNLINYDELFYIPSKGCLDWSPLVPLHTLLLSYTPSLLHTLHFPQSLIHKNIRKLQKAWRPTRGSSCYSNTPLLPTTTLHPHP